jgi:hypothetical protein
MADTQIITQLKFRVASLESALSDKQKELELYRTIEAQADSKVKSNPLSIKPYPNFTQKK